MNPTLVERFHRFAAEQPDRTALALGAGRLTRAGWDAQARAVAARLRRGSRVLVLLPSGMDFFTAFIGVLYAGACAVPAEPPTGGRRHFADIGVDAGIDAVVTTSAIAETARRSLTGRGGPAVR